MKLRRPPATLWQPFGLSESECPKSRARNMPGSMAGRMPAATGQSGGGNEMSPGNLAFERVLGCAEGISPGISVIFAIKH